MSLVKVLRVLFSFALSQRFYLSLPLLACSKTQRILVCYVLAIPLVKGLACLGCAASNRRAAYVSRYVVVMVVIVVYRILPTSTVAMTGRPQRC